MEQEKQGKKVSKFGFAGKGLAVAALATSIAFGAVACKQPTGPDVPPPGGPTGQSEYTGFPHGKLGTGRGGEWEKYVDWNNDGILGQNEGWQTGEPATDSATGTGFRVGTEYQIHRDANGAITVLTTEPTRTYSSTDSDLSHLRQEKVIAVNCDLNPDGTQIDRTTGLGVPEPEPGTPPTPPVVTVNLPPVPSTISDTNVNSQFNINLAYGSGSLVAGRNAYDSNMHNSLTSAEAKGVVRDLLLAMKQQADTLETYFDSIQVTNAPDLAAFFDGIAAAEAQIKAGKISGTDITARTFLENIEYQRDNILIPALTAAFGTDTASADKFNDLFELYKKYTKVVTRDWNTGAAVDGDGKTPQQQAQAAGDEFIGERINYHTTYGDGTDLMGQAGPYDNLRGITIQGIGGVDGWNKLPQFKMMEDKMLDLIVGKLDNLTTEQQATARTALRALIIQLGQDAEELRAFKTDVEAEWTNYQPTNYDTILDTDVTATYNFAQIAPQSSVRLASHIKDDAHFSRDLLAETKTSADGREYTGNFIPYRKDGQELV
jgi:hypothetical protein